MSFLRFLLIMVMVVMVGGIIFFSSVVAPALFTVLRTRELGGAVVVRSLAALHWIGIISALVFLASSFVLAGRGLIARHILVAAMLALTMASEFGVSRRMTTLRTSMGEIDTIVASDPRRVEFNRLHRISTT